MALGVGSKPNRDIDIELQPIQRNGNGNDGAAYLPNEQVTAANGEGLAYSSKQFPGSNGDTHPSGHAAEAQEPFLASANTHTQEQISSVCKIKTDLNEVIFWKVRLWMVIIFIFFLIAVVIAISLAVCSVIHEDVDEKYDPSSFEIPRYFNGSFRLTNQIFTAELLTPSNQSQALSAELQGKLADLYRSSPALGRYFSTAEVYAFSNGSVVAQYRLKFLMPAEHDQLEKFTLSREVVYNVFRQFLYDQEPETEPMYIDPLSLNMF
uniref:TPA-induced transmembrane protein homolog n=1 Tax=Centroberyx gerrardi TaxID=166262 RepID=UPI003AAB73CE